MFILFVVDAEVLTANGPQCTGGRQDDDGARTDGDGNFSNAKGVGAGVSEYKVDSGPGCRIYFGMDGGTLVILLYGGSKQGQSNDIAAAKAHWTDYKKRKRLAKE